MMSNYDRTMELVDAAYDSTGASQKQFEKTLESLETKLNKLQNAWNEFTMHLANNEIIKGAVDVLTLVLTAVNKLLAVLPNTASSITALVLSLTALKGAGTALRGVFNLFSGDSIKGILKIAKDGEEAATKLEIIKALTEKFEGMSLGKTIGIISEKLKTIGPSLKGIGPNLKTILSDTEKTREAISKLGRSMTNLIPYAAAIAALATALYTLYVAFNKDEIQIKNVAGAVEELKLESAALSETLTELQDTRESFEDLSEEFDTLVVGTKAWNDKLIESNKLISDFVTAHPNIEFSIDENGRYTIDDSAWDEYEQKLQNQQLQVSNASVAMTQRGNTLQAQLDLEDFGFGIESAEYIVNNLDDLLSKSWVEFAAEMENQGIEDVSLSDFLSLRDSASELTKAWYDYAAAVDSEKATIGSQIRQSLQDSGIGEDIAKTAGAIAAKNYSVEDTSGLFFADGATEDQAKDWMEKMGYQFVSFSHRGDGVKYKDVSGEEHAISNEEVMVQLNVLKAKEQAAEIGAIVSENITASNAGFQKSIQELKSVGSVEDDLFSKILAGDDTAEIAGLGLIEQDFKDSLNDLIENIDDEHSQKKLIGAYLGLDTKTMNKSVDYYVNQLAEQLNDSYDSIEEVQANRSKEFAKILAQGLEIPKEGNDLTEDLAAAFIKKFDEEQKNQYVNLANSLGEILGNDAFEAFVQGSLGMGENIEGLTDVMTQLQEIDYTSSVSAFKSLSKYAKSGDDYISQMAQSILNASDNALNLGTQFQEVYSTIVANDDFSDDLDDAIEDNNGKILSADIKALANQSSLLADFLENAEISATALAEAFTQCYTKGMSMTDVTEAGLKLLSTMYALEGVVEDAFDTIDNFEPARDTGEISQYYSDITDTMSEMLRLGEYGNDQLSSYMELMFEDDWVKALDTYGGDLQKAASQFESKINKIKDNLFGVWDDLATGYTDSINKFNEAKKTAFNVYKDASGVIVMEFGNMTTNEVVAAIKEIYGVSEDFAKAMLADFKNYSPDFAYKIKDNDFNAGVMEQIQSGTYNFNAGQEDFDNYATLFTQGDLTSAADLIGMRYDEYIKKLGKMVGITKDTTEEIEQELRKKGMYIVKDVDKTTNEIVEDVKTTFNEIMSAPDEKLTDAQGLIKQFSTDEVFDIDAFQNYAESIGLAEEAVNQLLVDVAKTDGDFTMELNGVKIEKSDLAAAGANVTDVLDQAVENAHWEKVGSSIVDGLLTGLGDFTKYLADAIGDGTKSGLSDAQIAMIGFFNNWQGKKLEVGVELNPSLNLPTSIGDEALSGTLGENVFIQTFKEAQAALKEANTGNGKAVGWLDGDGRTEDKGSNSNKNKINELPEPLDKLYNTYQRIDKELRLINKYQERYNRLLEQANVTGVNLKENLEKQIKYYTLLEKRATYAKQTRNEQIKEKLNSRIEYIYQDDGGNDVLAKSKKLKNYFQWDEEYGLFTIDYKKINKLADDRKNEKDLALFDALTNDVIPKIEGWQDDIEEANDNLEDAKNALEDIQKKGRDAYRDLEDRVYDAIVYREQERIDKLEQINDAIDEANSSLVDAIQKNIDKIRQDRENQETEDDIAKKERRLSYLRRDTSNANAVEIKQLEEELADTKQDYTDTLIDQKISELQDQNEEASEQRQQQIDLLQAQLDWDEKNGYFWTEAHALIEKGIDEEGKLVETEELVALLKSAEGWEGMSSVEQMDWYTELQSTAAEGWLWLKNNLNTALGLNTLQYQYETGKVSEGDSIKYTQGNNKTQTGTVNNGNAIYEGKVGDGVYFQYGGDGLIQDAEGNWITQEDLKSARRFEKGKKISVRAKKNGSTEIVKIAATAGSDGIMYSDSTSKPFTNLEITTDGIYYTKAARKMVEANPKKFPGIKFKYATGGLADFTGPAWLDGSTSKPELVLNAKDTENFIQLKNVLRSLMNGGVSNSANSGVTNYEINIEVEKLSNDYDVEQVADKVKRMIVSDSKYRNVNAINKLR